MKGLPGAKGSASHPPGGDAGVVWSAPMGQGSELEGHAPKPDCSQCDVGVCGRHCGAANHQPELYGRWCSRPKGHQTPHPGIGHCKLHGGNTPAQITAAGRELAGQHVVTFGLPREVDPQQALLEEVHRTAGHVAWLQTKIAGLVEDTELKQRDKSDQFERPAVWVEMYQEERKHLARVSEAAVRCGIAERQVKLAEAQGAQLAAVLRGVLDATFAALLAAGAAAELVTRIQREQVPAIVRQHLLEVVEGKMPALEISDKAE